MFISRKFGGVKSVAFEGAKFATWGHEFLRNSSETA